MRLRKVLQELYLDYRNDYLTVDKFAEHNLLAVDDAAMLIELGRKIHAEGVNFEHMPEKHVY